MTYTSLSAILTAFNSFRVVLASPPKGILGVKFMESIKDKKELNIKNEY